MIKILLAEDHSIVRTGIRPILETHPEIEVIDEAPNGNDVLQKIASGQSPDIVLTDINMPDLDGLELLKKIRELQPEVKVIILSMLDHERYVQKAMSIGACGYLLKNASGAELVFSIQHVMSGSKYISSELSMRFLTRLPQDDINIEEGLKGAASLSKREREILFLIAEGYTNSEIAEKLFTSRRTVEGHRLNLIEKTRARNTAALIRFAVKNGIID